VKRRWLLRPRPLKINLKLRREVSPLMRWPLSPVDPAPLESVVAVVDVVVIGHAQLEVAVVAVERPALWMRGPRLKVHPVVVEVTEVENAAAVAVAIVVLEKTVPPKLSKVERPQNTTTEVRNKFMVTREKLVRNITPWIVNQELALDAKT